MPSLQTIKDRVTDLEGLKWDLMLSRQATYLAANSRYWQGLLTHVVAPSHDDLTDRAREGDRQTDKPTEQAESWRVFWPEIQGRPFSKALRCDVYDGPQGQGYTISAEFRHNGILHKRARNNGPETYRTHDWRVVDESFALAGGLLVDLISFWELEEASGTRFDAHGTNDLTDVNGVGQAIGKVGNAANFVRANGEKLTHVTNASLETGDINFSFALWVRHTLETVALNILYKGIDNPAKEYGLRYEDTIDRFRWVISNGSGDRIVDANTFGAPTQGDWHFIVVSHDEANDEMGISINNGAIDTLAMGGFTPVVQAKNFVIGEAATPSRAFNGDIDQVGFWKRILVPAEITFLYNNGNGRSFAEISAF